jgi:hypothetical protein
LGFSRKQWRNSVVNKLASGATLVGNSDGNAKEVVLSGEAVLSNTGVISLNNDAVISKR